jgi:hypothetical protein
MTLTGFACEVLPKDPGHLEDKFTMTTAAGLMGAAFGSNSKKKNRVELP